MLRNSSAEYDKSWQNHRIEYKLADHTERLVGVPLGRGYLRHLLEYNPGVLAEKYVGKPEDIT